MSFKKRAERKNHIEEKQGYQIHKICWRRKETHGNEGRGKEKQKLNLVEGEKG